MSGERDRRVTKERPRVGRVEGQGKDRRNDPRTDPITFISALHLTSSGPFLISLRPAGAPLRGTRWKGYEVRDETRADMMWDERQTRFTSLLVSSFSSLTNTRRSRE